MLISDAPRRCAVLGSPIAHSLSPALHRAGYAAAGLEWRYDAYEVDETSLPGFLAGLDDEWRGLSLTMPLKRCVLPLLDSLSECAQQAQAVNTVLREGGRLLGDNTDVPGAVAAVRERTGLTPRIAVVLGGGATAGSMVLALAELGCDEITLVVREPARAAESIAVAARHPRGPRVDVRTPDDPVVAADMVVSTIPATAQERRWLAWADPASVIFDVVYDPWPTPLARLADRTGRTLVGGLDLLVHQASLQFTLFTGIAPAPLQAMHTAGARAIAAHEVTG